MIYKAQDNKLDRTVALKFLPPHLTQSDEDKQRFIREAKAAAALNHSNVCTIYDIQEYKDAGNDREHLFIIMEYVEGQSLRDKINTITFKQAIEFGTQIADGLAAAHEHSIVHRDIKPENIMVRKDGRVLIMDFGLAKPKGSVTKITKEGSTVGTAGYMSPEQIQGLDTDHRSDIFSLGVVLYEMFTRQMPFKGMHETALAYEIVNVDPEPLSAVNTELDPAIDTIVLDCLEKDPAERCQSAAEVARNLRRFKRSSDKHKIPGTIPGNKTANIPEQLQPPAKKFQPSYMVMSMVGILFMLLIALQFFRSGEDVERRVIKSHIHSEPGTSIYHVGPNPGPVAVSPDGSMITYTGLDPDGNYLLWVHALNDLHPRPLRGTDNASSPFWSPDSRSIGFFSGGALRFIPAAGGIPETITGGIMAGFGGTWNDDGIILYGGGPLEPIKKIHTTGGEPVAATSIDRTAGENLHRWPYFLPDGNHFIYLINGEKPENDGIYLGSLTTDKKQLLFRNSSSAIYASGHILYVRENTLLARPFDVKRLEFTGDPVPIADHVIELPVMERGGFAASHNGILAYHPVTTDVSGGNLNLYDRSGKIVNTMGEPNPYGFVRFSSDGQKAAVTLLEPRRTTNDIWWFDIERNTGTRLTYEDPSHAHPVWSPDGTIAFHEITENQYRIKIRSLYDDHDERIVFQSDQNFIPTSWSPDGNYIGGFKVRDQENPSSLWVVPLDENEEPFQVFPSRFNDQYLEFSPDGNWIAYESDETGRSEIYIRPFPGPGRRWQISTDGGLRPVWTKNGREIIYIDRNRVFTAVEVGLREGGVEVGEVSKLFTPESIFNVRGFDVTSDGQTFIVTDIVTDDAQNYITLVVNWDADIHR